MLTSSEKKDYILRLIEQMRRLVEALLGKLRDGGDAQHDVAEARDLLARLLGPMAGLAPRMDSVTAGQMVGDPDVLGAWAELTAAEAELLRARGDDAAAGATQRRALELALEAHLRTNADQPDLLELIARLRPAVRGQALAPRHGDALEALGDDGGTV
ncbi:MAG TPA: hypothetical protein VM890_03735 [Longimicrobium sp.]|nr:hypothetical protein [Longimicrobium sp.]